MNSANPSQRSTDASTPGGIAGTPDSAADAPLSPVRSWEIGLDSDDDGDSDSDLEVEDSDESSDVGDSSSRGPA